MTPVGVRFGRAILMVRGATGVAQSVNFYQNALGFEVTRHTDEWAELICPISSGEGSHVTARSTDASQSRATFKLNIKAVESEAQLSYGYTPFLNFETEDMDSAVAKCAQMGAHLDGPIQYPAHGKVAVLRAPDGHMIGLYEPNLL
eukprot:CAMPEP_0184858048 /NCGR_PEP_ID=MMETSP0580-20130426/3163_1 /TAXON_ID=1118495 /ORGANISM="Dactyliosolen fragilissimus" /LENGTH=145 /DNA_ID=CAMNT_0027353967 /DNA_START=59 /DNA_END=496 /DNA_ORIENTATION=+